MSVAVPKAELIGVFLGSLLYGTYISIFLQCLQVLRRKQHRPSGYLLGTAITLFVLVTAHLVINVFRCMDAFTSNMATPYYPSIYYGVYDRWQNIVKDMVYVAVTLVSDALILYRSFVLWNRNYFVNFVPLLLFLADTATGILVVYTLSSVTSEDNPYRGLLSTYIKVFGVLALALNVICTSLIVIKILEIQRAVAPFVKGGGEHLPRLVATIVESGSVYPLILLVMLIAFAKKSPLLLVLLNILPSIIGIVVRRALRRPLSPMLTSYSSPPSVSRTKHAPRKRQFSSVIVRVGLASLANDEAHSHHTRPRSGDIHVRSGVPANGAPLTSHVAHPLRYFPQGGIQVALSHTVHTHVDATFPTEDADTDGRRSEDKVPALEAV